jgi:hypothetical protein
MGGAFGISLIMIFFWMPETAFVRTGVVNLDTGSNNVSQICSSDDSPLMRLQVMTEINLTHKMDAEHLDHEKNGSGRSAETPEHLPAQDEKLSYTKELLPYSGYINHISFFNTLFRPFMMLGSPAVLWATLLFTTCISWLVGISVTLSQIFSAPPYNFSVSAVGLTNLSSFVASILGTLVAGPLIDGVVRKMSMRNGGTFGQCQSTPYIHSSNKFQRT